jgi:hypothetical protein
MYTRAHVANVQHFNWTSGMMMMMMMMALISWCHKKDIIEDIDGG